VSWWASEALKTSLLALAVAGVFLAGKAWPDLEAPLWAVFLGAIGYHIYREEKKPVVELGYGPYLEAKWLVQMRDRRFVEMMDEWPHRRLLLRTFAEHLPGFDAAAAKKGIRSREKGQWVCFERSTSAV
jgi:hypothetical protein